LDGHARHGRSHDRGARRPQARARLHQRGDGRSQARRVRADAHLPVPRGSGEVGPAMSATGTTARLRYLRTSPTKVRPVLRLIQGQDIASARNTLALCERAVGVEVGKLLDSAVANAENNDSIPADELFVRLAFADEGPTAKRWRPRARGRGTRIRK